MRRPGSIAARLVVLLTLGTTLLWCVGAGYATYASYRELRETLDDSMRQMALRLLPLARDDVVAHEDDDARVIAEEGVVRPMQVIYRLTDARGKVILSLGDRPDIPWDQGHLPGFSSSHGYRFFRAVDPADGIAITMAAALHDRHEALIASAEAMLWPLALLIPLQGLVILWGVRRGLRPVEGLRAEIARRGSQDLSPLDPGAQPRELKPVAEALARLMERLRVALDAERAFAANAAHELRTPIAGALAQTQRLLTELHRPETRHRAGEIEATLKRLARLSEKLIQISRVDAGIGLAEAVAELKPVLDIVVADARAHTGAGGRLVYVPDAVPRLAARMDADAFAIALRNLLENALRHGAPGEPVEVWVEGAAVHVANGGPVVPPEALAGLTGRFVRRAGGAEGSGLGLAIVQAIMSQSGGTLELASPRPGRKDGFLATLRLPAA